MIKLTDVPSCNICGFKNYRWLDCEECPKGECPIIVCCNCGNTVAEV